MVQRAVPQQILQLTLGREKDIRAYIDYLIEAVTHHDTRTTLSGSGYPLIGGSPSYMYPLDITTVKHTLKLAEQVQKISAMKTSWWLWPKTPDHCRQGCARNRFLCRLTLPEGQEYIVYRHGHNTGQNFWVIDIQTKKKHQMTRAESLLQILDLLQNPDRAPLYMNSKDKHLRCVALKILEAKDK